MLLLLFGTMLAGIYATGRIVPGERGSGFYALLGEYDFKYRRIVEAGHAAMRQELDGLENELNRLERKTEGVESWLSVLKRRRQLAGFDPHYRQAYAQSIRRAALAFPHSGPIAAVAAEALVHDAAITREGEAALRGMLPLIYDSQLVPVRLGLHVLLGDFTGPRHASAVLSLPEISGLLGDLPPGFAGLGQFQTIFADLAILKILAGDSAGAAADMRAAIGAASGAAPSPDLIRLAAEYSYDFGDLLRSAELFSALPDDAALSRQADALWLAGYADSARAIWSIQAGQPAALYNLALTAQTQQEAAALLERLAAQGAGDHPSRKFGLIRYSRLLDARQAIAVLEGGKGPGAVTANIFAPASSEASADEEALIELEILRRRTEISEVARVIAETWMLVERFPEAEDIYHWGAWYFNLQRSYAESALLHNAAERRGFTGQWLGAYGALRQIREGSLDAAEETLGRAVALGEGADWAAQANLGRILEARRASSRALANYEQAMAAIMDSGPSSGGWQDAASRIQVRIASCLKTLGRPDESRIALEYALELNPDNLRARLELGRQ
ncbi:MAG: hypothetical protein LBQ69_01145 [Treponema sp.]|jgi:tetratricopeptide (TPR) repeat protein|nr:hypothetical protein [Treponema sp.]